VALAWRRTARRVRSGSTLIEMLTVLTLLALLSVPMVDALIQRLAEARQREEARQMDRIGEGFRQAVLSAKQVPSTNQAEWSALVAAQIGITDDLVATNREGGARLLIYDPALGLGGLAVSGLPFRQ
jgi:type II secretory pathway pseudopilin PulG